MKIKNIYLIFANALVASVLFYNSSFGVNCFIFSLWTCALLNYKNKLSASNALHLSLFIITGASIFYAPQILSISLFFIHVFIIIGAHQTNIKGNMYRFLQGLIDAITWLKTTNKKHEKEKKESFKLEKYVPYLIASPLIIVFFLLYSNGNPLVDFYTNQIDFSFIKIGSIFFFFCMVYFSVPFINGGKQLWINKSISNSEMIVNDYQKSSDLERQSFRVILISLSVLLSIVHLIDFSTLVTLSLPEEVTYSQFVNQGFWTLVTSILLSIALVLYFFRGPLNFLPNINQFVQLATLWLLLNLGLVITTGIKNGIYVYEYGLTYKRIAVFFFLITAIPLLLICLAKIKNGLKMDVFIGRSFQTVLIICTLFVVVHWDTAITKFNLSGYTLNHDISYLQTLKNNKDLFLTEPELIHIKLQESVFEQTEKWNETTIKTLLNSNN